MSEEFKGYDGVVIVEPLKVTLKFKKSTAGKTQKEIYLRNISAIEIKKPSFLNRGGYIEFLYPGMDSRDENVINIIGDSQYLQMLRAKQLIEHYISEAHAPERTAAPAAASAPSSPSSSVVDEIKKAAELREAGILSNQEFDELKRRLLS
jgi:hypothetical protein